MSKLEKADILEMTIEYINQIKQCNKNSASGEDSVYKMGFNECNAYVIDYLDSDVCSDTSESGLRARLVKHLSSVTSSSDSKGTELQIVGIIAPKPGQEESRPIVNITHEAVGKIESKFHDQTIPACIVRENPAEIDATRTDDPIKTNFSENSTHRQELNDAAKNINPEKVLNVTVPKKRKVLGDISNSAPSSCTNKNTRKFQRNDRNVDRVIPKPLKKRITEQMLQTSVDIPTSNSYDTNSANCAFMGDMATVNRLCQSTESSQSTDSLYPTFTGSQSNTSDYFNDGFVAANDMMACRGNERLVQNVSSCFGQENTPVVYTEPCTAPVQTGYQQSLFYPAQMSDYQAYLQGAVGGNVWRPW